jgi:hypothetical protein
MDLRLPLLSDKLVREHITDCDQCAELVVDFGALDDSLSQIPIATLQRLSGLQPEENPADAPTHLHPFSFIVSIASILLVVLTSGIWFSNEGDESTFPEIAQIESTDLQPEGPSNDSAYVSIVSPTDLQFVHPGHKTAEPADFIDAVRVVDWQREVGPYLQMTADLPGVRPVARTVNATFLFFSTPPSTDPNTPIESSSPKDASESPDLGLSRPPKWLLCCV